MPKSLKVGYETVLISILYTYIQSCQIISFYSAVISYENKNEIAQSVSNASKDGNLFISKMWYVLIITVSIALDKVILHFSRKLFFFFFWMYFTQKRCIVCPTDLLKTLCVFSSIVIHGWFILWTFSALRKTMLKAHRRAWLWQDEWYGLSMDDIREIERQTQEILRKKMAAAMGSLSVESIEPGDQDELSSQKLQQRANDNPTSTEIAATLSSIEKEEYKPGTSSKRTTSSRLWVLSLLFGCNFNFGNYKSDSFFILYTLVLAAAVILHSQQTLRLNGK